MASYSIILFEHSREYLIEYKQFFLAHHLFAVSVLKQILLTIQILSKLIIITQEILENFKKHHTSLLINED